MIRSRANAGLNDFALLELACYIWMMTAATALDRQIEHYRRMTGEQRLAVALDLHEMSCEIAREGIRRQNPKASVTEVERLVHRRLATHACCMNEREIKPKNT
jgi:hypothetical protein